jgi:membrane protein DedA with SNARE-associated domain
VPIDQIKDLIYVLAGWFGVLVSAAFGNPVPEELWIATAGGHASTLTEFGLLRFLVWPVVIAGALVADVLLYGLGRLFGARLLEMKWMQRLSPPEKRQDIAENFHRYGFVIFMVGRLVPGIRTTLFLTAGTMRLNLLRFCLADGIGGVFGGSIFFFLGYGLGSHFIDILKSVEERIAPYKAVLIILVLGVVALYLLYAFLRHPIPTGDPKDVPIIGPKIAAHLPDKERVANEPEQAPAEGTQPSEAHSRTEARG